ncbi:hypothetical protein C8R44DRAFT_742049 [Mycena epipterygia]|nr:hypothetical protein C8R44DRAFT_742049 [Mycena epipterygia]
MKFISALFVSFFAVAAANPVVDKAARQVGVLPSGGGSGAHCDIAPFLVCDGGLEQESDCEMIPYQCQATGVPPITTDSTCAAQWELTRNQCGFRMKLAQPTEKKGMQTVAHQILRAQERKFWKKISLYDRVHLEFNSWRNRGPESIESNVSELVPARGPINTILRIRLEDVIDSECGKRKKRGRALLRRQVQSLDILAGQRKRLESSNSGLSRIDKDLSPERSKGQCGCVNHVQPLAAGRVNYNDSSRIVESSRRSATWGDSHRRRWGRYHCSAAADGEDLARRAAAARPE